MNKLPAQMVVLFGATGDLTKRYLIPALFRLYEAGRLHDKNPIICLARKPFSQQQYIKHLVTEEFIKDADPQKIKSFLSLVHYYTIDFDCVDCSDIKHLLDSVDQKFGCNGYASIYLSTPPSLFTPILDLLDRSEFKFTDKVRVAFEKPFGYDVSSAKKLQKSISRFLTDQQVYRIDHYLTKELIQNLFVLRFGNSIVEHIWNNEYVDHIQVTLSEHYGMEGRGNYYDGSGALRDMVQNHLLQVLSIVTMDEPKSIHASDIQKQKIKVLKKLQPVKKDDVVLAQYATGQVDGVPVVGYLQEDKVPKTSTTETFAAMKLFIDNKRWQGVPIYLRVGKRMTKRSFSIHLVLKDVSCKLFSKNNICEPSPNIITIHVQPDEDIRIRFNVKTPGHGFDLEKMGMHLMHHGEQDRRIPQAYETIFQAFLSGDQSVFADWPTVLESWKFIDDLKAKKAHQPLAKYKSGTMGPKESDNLLTGLRSWIN